MIIKLNDGLQLSDVMLDNPNYVDVIIGEHEVTVSLDELLSAVTAFEQKRVMRQEYERRIQV
jgi:hypothetical protein